MIIHVGYINFDSDNFVYVLVIAADYGRIVCGTICSVVVVDFHNKN